MIDKQVAINRGAQAEALLRNEMLLGAFKSLEGDYLKAWGSTTVGETQARENLWRATQILGDVLNHLKLIVRDGKIAQQDVERMAGMNRAA